MILLSFSGQASIQGVCLRGRLDRLFHVAERACRRPSTNHGGLLLALQPLHTRNTSVCTFFESLANLFLPLIPQNCSPSCSYSHSFIPALQFSTTTFLTYRRSHLHCNLYSFPKALHSHFTAFSLLSRTDTMKLSTKTVGLIAAAWLASAIQGALAPPAYNIIAYAPILVSYAASSAPAITSRPVKPSALTASSFVTTSSTVVLAAPYTNPSSIVAPMSVHTTEVVYTSVSSCSEGQTIVQSGSTTVLSHPSTITIHISRTTTIPLTRTLVRSSRTELRPRPFETSTSSAYPQSGPPPPVSYTNSTTVQPVQPPQTYTMIRLTTKLCTAGQTVTRRGSAVVLPTPSTSTYEMTSTWIRTFECTSTRSSVIPIYSTTGVLSPQSYVSMMSGVTHTSQGVTSALPTGPATASSVPDYMPTPMASGLPGSSPLVHTSNSPVQSSGPAASSGASVPTYAPVPISNNSPLASLAPAQTYISSLIATSPVPYPVAGSGAAASCATGTMGIAPMPSSMLSPYNPGSAAARSLRGVDLAGTGVAVVAAAVYLFL